MTESWFFSAFRRVAFVTLSTLALSGCASTGADGPKSNDSLRDLAVWAGFATKVQEAPDFVKESRPASTDYMPVGVTPSGPAKKARKLTPEELKALQDELDAAGAKNAAGASSTP
mgnify:CR=1 FL=1